MNDALWAIATVLQIISHYHTVLISISQSIHACFLDAQKLFTQSFSFIDIKNVYQFINSEEWECSPPGKAGVPGLYIIRI